MANICTAEMRLTWSTFRSLRTFRVVVLGMEGNGGGGGGGGGP